MSFKKVVIPLSTAAFLLLAGCEEEKQDLSKDNSNTDAKVLSLSQALEENKVWIAINTTSMERDTAITDVYSFKNGKSTRYNLIAYNAYTDNFTSKDDLELTTLTLEDASKLSNDDLVSKAKDITEEQDKLLQENFIDVPLNYKSNLYKESIESEKSNWHDPEGSRKKFVSEFGKDVKPFESGDFEDIKFTIENEKIDFPSKYNLDIELDEQGQNPKSMTINLEGADSMLQGFDVKNLYTNYMMLKGSPYIAYRSLEANPRTKEGVEQTYVEQVEELEEYGTFKTDDKEPKNFVPDPLTWSNENEEIYITPEFVSQKIFDATYKGFVTGGGLLITHTKNNDQYFKLDEKSNKKKNMTIEGK